MRLDPEVIGKVQRINDIRRANSEKLVANGDEALEPYEFDYMLLCNKICGNNHYNMQMKIVVESEEEYNAWIKEQKVFKNSLVQY
jgi:cytochrome c oxidase subunit 2